MTTFVHDFILLVCVANLNFLNKIRFWIEVYIFEYKRIFRKLYDWLWSCFKLK
jgi:hypothetical protein